MSFCTAINCMDGRVQQPVWRYLRRRFHVRYVDMITEPGPCAVLSERVNRTVLERILDRCVISIELHRSVGLAIVGHYDCAGNPVPEPMQKEQIERAAQFLHDQWPELPTVGLWIDHRWKVRELCCIR
ncbi:MAG: hypothetical protein GXP27_13155 [Planctomycetes bacterium]|nr:hypothetical protein [Planctomycetota bacterium]